MSTLPPIRNSSLDLHLAARSEFDALTKAYAIARRYFATSDDSSIIVTAIAARVASAAFVVDITILRAQPAIYDPLA